MKTVRRIVDFFFNLILPVDSEMEKLREMNPQEIFSLLQKASKQKYDFARAIFSYKDSLVKKMIWQMKFRENYWVAEVFGNFLAQFITREFLCAREVLNVGGDSELTIVPIPIHKKRRAERGYNQCEWLCEEIMKNILIRKNLDGRIPSSAKLIYDKEILTRVKYRTKQSWSSRGERFENARGIFAVRDGVQVSGRQFLIIDDVITTGATLNEARRTLLATGASSVICLAIAH